MPNIKFLKTTSIVLHMFIGLGALAGGLAAVTNPTSPLGIPTDMLKNGPFDDFLIPGLFLMLVLGLGNIFAGISTIIKHKWWPYFSGAMGDTLILWIVIQCLILYTIAALHVIFFGLGVLQSMIALATIYQNKQFPFDKG